MSALKIFLAALLFLILNSAFLTHPTFAQESTPSASSLPTTNYQLPTYVSPTSPVYTDLMVSNMFHTLSCLAAGFSTIGQPCLTYKLQKNAEGAIQSVPILGQANLSGGALGAATSLIDALYVNRPLRTADYIASVKGNLGIAKEAHAQVEGSGSDVLDPILNLWKVSRNWKKKRWHWVSRIALPARW